MIFIAGLHYAGKTHFAKFLEEEGFPFIDLGPTLRNIWETTSSHLSFGDFIRPGEGNLGNNFIDELLSAEVSKRLRQLEEEGSNKDLLIVGSRSIAGIEFIRSNCPEINGRKQVVIYIEANETTLYSRCCQKDSTPITLSKFKQVLEKDRQMGVEAIREIANFVIDNDGSLGEFEQKIESLIFNALGFERITKKRGKERDI